MVCTTLTFAPLAMASEAAVCRRACGVRPVRPVTRTAGSKLVRRKLRRCSTPPFCAAKTKSPGALPATCAASSLGEEPRNGHLPALVGLRGAEHRVPVDVDDRLGDQGAAAQQVQV